MAIHAGLGVRHIGLGRHFHKAVTIPAIHSQLRHVNIVRKGHRLDRLITHFRIFRRPVIPCRRSQPADDDNAANHELDGQPICPAWKEICHDYKSSAALAKLARHAANKSKLSSGSGWFRRCKGLRLIARPRGNEDSINRSREGKINFVVDVDSKIVV